MNNNLLKLYQLPTFNFNINNDLNIKTNNNISNSLFKLGYYYELINLKNNYILNYDIKKLGIFNIDELKNILIKYNNHNSKFNDINIINNKFYYIWEILSIFKIYDDNKSISILSINDNTTEYINSVLYYRIKNSIIENNELYKKDIYDLLCIDNEILDDIKLNKNINLLSSNSKNKNKYDLIIGGGDIIAPNINLKEQYLNVIKLNEIINSLKLLNINGTFIMKYYDITTITSSKYIALLISCFEQIFFYKPVILNDISSEIYIVMLNFKGLSLDDNIINELQKIKKNKNNISDLLSIIDNDNNYLELLNILKFINLDLMNNQIKSINKNIEYLNNNNNQMELLDKKNMQLQFWINTFLPINKNDKITNKNKIIEHIKNTIEKNKLELYNYNK